MGHFYAKLASLAKWLSVRLRTKWLWVRIALLSLKLQIWHLLRARSSLTFRQTIECGFTLKLVCDMIITYCQMHRTDKYSQHSSFIKKKYQASLANWLIIRLRTKWFLVRIALQSLKLQIWSLLQARSSLTFRQTKECGFTLKLVRDIIITYSHNS